MNSRSHRKRSEGAGMWPLDVALVLLALLILTLVLRLLRFDDTRWQYNAWTYLIGVPSASIAASMVARALVSERLERSIQLGFMISVATHLMLTLFAVNLVLFSGIWPDALENMERRVQIESRATQFVERNERESEERPDYLRPIATELTEPTPAEMARGLLVDALLNPSVSEDHEPTLAKRDSMKLEPAPLPTTAPEVSSEVAKLDRPSRELLPGRDATKIEIPKTQSKPLANVGEVGLSAVRDEAKRLDSARTSESESLASAIEPMDRAFIAELNSVNPARLMQPRTASPPTERLDVFAPSLEAFSESRPTTRSQRRSPAAQGGIARAIEIPSASELSSAKGAGVAGRIEQNATGFGDSAPLLDRTASERLSGGMVGVQPAGDRGGAVRGSAVQASAMEPTLNATGAMLRSPLDRRTEIAMGLPDALPVAPALPSPDLSRFRRRDAGAVPRASAVVPVPSPAFKQRMRRNEDAFREDLQAMGPLGPQTEEAIERGLQFLARYQREDGSWRLEDFGERPQLRSDTAATALALLAFQGAGYSHEQYKYQDNCKRAIDWLKRAQSQNGDLYRPMDGPSDRNAWLYSHGIAALALCEAYGMTQDSAIREPAQRAVDFLVSSQDPQGGGWRYAPRVGSDTSVTGWAMMALKSAELSGLRVPATTYSGIQRWLDGAEASSRERYLYRYNPLASTPQTQHGRIPTPVMTSVGLLMRLYLGWRRNHPDMVRGSDWLLERLPATGTVDAPLRDTYYWYYATQVMFHMGGDRWRGWYQSLYPILIDSQERGGEYAGSWEAGGAIPDAWGVYAGRLYVTTMNLLSLEVTYRHLPIYEATAE